MAELVFYSGLSLEEVRLIHGTRLFPRSGETY